ncbi:MAG: hypothetical protein KA928_07880 [Longilinea sp.]|nr:hypothetical protein [Longilinea sp.]
MVSTEQDLLSGARSFDLDALGAIYDRYSPGIYRYAMRLLGDENIIYTKKRHSKVGFFLNSEVTGEYSQSIRGLSLL